MSREVGYTVGGFLLVLWGLCGALLGQREMAAIAAVAGTIFFASGVVQLAVPRQKRVATWLRENF